MGVGVRGHETEKVGKRQRGDEGKRDEARERERERESWCIRCTASRGPRNLKGL